MKFWNNDIYMKDLETAFNNITDRDSLKNSRIFITGATGLIGSFIADMLMWANIKLGFNISLCLMGRSEDRLKKRFPTELYKITPDFYVGDIMNPIRLTGDYDYVIHCAGNAYPAAFVNRPSETIKAAVTGMENVIRLCECNKKGRMVLISSGEVYGNGNSTAMKENDYGYIDITSSRASYPEGKRISEVLLASYIYEGKIDGTIARLCHTYGPCYSQGDNRAGTEFLMLAAKGKDIVMKSKGSQLRSYCYIADCASGIMTALLKGNSGEAYNVANKDSVVSIAQLANTVASAAGTNVIFKLPDNEEKKYATPVDMAVLDETKLKNIGYRPVYDIETGVRHSIDIIRGCYE